MEEKKKAAFRLGIYVLIGLAVLTGIEFFLSGQTALLFVVGLAKAWAIIQYFMHVTSLWSEEGH